MELLNDARYFEPPEVPEVTAAYIWHEAGEHHDYEVWAKLGCQACEEDMDTLMFAVEFKFTTGQLRAAEKWAKENGFNYKNAVHQLLLDWAMMQEVDHMEVVPIGRAS